MKLQEAIKLQEKEQERLERIKKKNPAALIDWKGKEVPVTKALGYVKASITILERLLITYISQKMNG